MPGVVLTHARVVCAPRQRPTDGFAQKSATGQLCELGSMRQNVASARWRPNPHPRIPPDGGSAGARESCQTGPMAEPNSCGLRCESQSPWGVVSRYKLRFHAALGIERAGATGREAIWILDMQPLLHLVT